MLQVVIGCRERRWRKQGNEARESEKVVGCVSLSGSEDKRARSRQGPVAPRGIVAMAEKVRLGCLLPGSYGGECNAGRA